MTATTGKGRTTMRAAQAAETRQRLIDAAVAVFSEHSYDEVAVADIAKAAGVAHGLLFHYFGNKRGIYLAALRDASDRIVRVQGLNPELPIVQQIRAGFRAHLSYLAAHRGLALRLVLGGRSADAEAFEAFEAGRWQTIQGWTSLLGLDPQVPALRMMMRSAAGAIDEATLYWLQNGEPFDIESMIDALIPMVVAGFRAAAQLDPTLDVDTATQALLDSRRR
ncbi:TetR/AcrR family transcriptional regulator [Nocardia gipuzkoensis]|uniref:TetR/AcrR family transcriptional regulator n=1 Tax=Nocardia gipuzkoensis TaxID=2749991 RepID=UPI00237DF1D0|nr:TetR/AcrR family transcriptional regulator [Nocardia gipuzkoensis]MDE1674305.1 helix-turn-helix domain containing protein [Nocardia gipuzkoensis]